MNSWFVKVSEYLQKNGELKGRKQSGGTCWTGWSRASTCWILSGGCIYHHPTKWHSDGVKRAKPKRTSGSRARCFTQGRHAAMFSYNTSSSSPIYTCSWKSSFPTKSSSTCITSFKGNPTRRGLLNGVRGAWRAPRKNVEDAKAHSRGPKDCVEYRG